MSPELLQAVKERLELGYSHDAIKDELKAAGYDNATLNQVLHVATSTPGPAPIPMPNHENIDTAVAESSSGKISLPPVGSLLSNAFSFATNRLDLVALLIVPSLVFAFLEYTSTGEGVGSDMMIVGAGIFGLFAFVAYLVVMAMVLFSVAHYDRKVNLSESFAWVRGAIGSLIWVYILAALVSFGGFMLFIIPGIIISVYVYFSQYVLVVEGKRGMDALMRSRDLVRGHWWDVAIKLLGVSLVLFGIFFIVAFAIGIVSYSAEGGAIDLITEIVAQVFGAVVTIIGLHVGVSLYRSLAAAKPSPTTDYMNAKGKYLGLTVLGLLFPVIVILLAVVLASLNSAIDSGNDAALKMSLSTSRSMAEIYYNENNLSYDGVCDEIEFYAALAKYSDCIDAPGTWAMSVTDDSDQQSCVDSKGGQVPGGVNVVTGLCQNTEEPTNIIGPSGSAEAKQRAADLRAETAPINTADLQYQTNLVSTLQQQYVNNGYSYEGSCATVETSDLVIWALICSDSEKYFVYTYLDEDTFETACSDSRGNIAIQDSFPEEGFDCRGMPF
tara:strand:- start:1860 stop:3521 length:1662 start_codon:yes stop_codon:yes gene_type:complete